MKKFWTILLVSALAFSVAGCKRTEAETGGNGGGETTTLVVGFDAEFPPYGFIAADGSYDGFDLAMAKEVCKRLGWEYKELAIDWSYKDAQLQSGDINCIWNGFTYTGREDQYAWTEPYVDNSIVVVVLKDSGIENFADLAGKKLMVQAGSSAADALNAKSDFKASLAEVVELPDYITGFAELNMRSVDAVAVDQGVAAYQIANNPDAYTVLEETVSTEQYAVGFALGNEVMRDAVNRVLKEMAADGTMAKIAENYLDKGLVMESLCMIN